ncbi:MAG: hypothetical protein ACR2KT_15325 [Methylocella sp.]
MPIDIIALNGTAGHRKHGLIMGGNIMHSNNSNGSRAALARGFMAMGLDLLATPAEAAPSPMWRILAPTLSQ